MTPPQAADDASSLSVLFVDDEEAVLRTIKRILGARAGLTLLTASNGEEALSVLRTRAVDVLVSDIDMPKMSGLELVRVACKEFPGTLRILLTGAGTMDRALSAINEGEVVRFFTKPFDAEVLSRTLDDLGQRVLALRRERQAGAQRERCEEFFRWIDVSHPGTLTLERGEHGELVIDLSPVQTYLKSAPAEIRQVVEGTGE